MDASGTIAPAVPGEYIIGFSRTSTPAQREDALRTIAPTSVEPLGLIDGALVRLDKGRVLDPGSLPGAVAGVVEYVQPNHLHQLRGVASAPPNVNDPEFAKQYSLQNTGQGGGTPGADMKIPAAWASATGAGVVVAVADTNIDITHPDLAGNIWTNAGEVAGNGKDDDGNGYVDDVHGWNFGRNNNKPEDGRDTHGTHTSGTVGAVTGNGVGIAGVAPDVKIMPLAILTSSATTANAIKAFDYAAKNGANIISNSWGNNTYEPALAAAVAAATKAGLMVVVAAGNENWDTGVHGSYPDNYAGSVSVAASDSRDAKASYSNRGTTTIDVAAPGDKVHSSVPGGKYAAMSGTSMAAPGYAGVAALVKSRYPQMTMKQVEDRIHRSVQRDGSAAPWNTLVASGGRVDAAAALLPIATPSAPAPAADRAVVGQPVKLAWTADIADGQRFEVQVAGNAGATAAMAETFEGGATTRAFQSDGTGTWKPVAGVGADGSWGMRATGLKSGVQSRLQLTEVLAEPTEVSFRYKAGGSEMSFFVDRDLQMQPTKSGDWLQYSATLPAGEHTFTWLATGGSGADGVILDELRIGAVREATWKTVATTPAGATTAEWTPDAATSQAAVRVRASNGSWAGDWVEGPKFAVTSAR